MFNHQPAPVTGFIVSRTTIIEKTLKGTFLAMSSAHTSEFSGASLKFGNLESHM